MASILGIVSMVCGIPHIWVLGPLWWQPADPPQEQVTAQGSHDRAINVAIPQS